jgi:23S rRNA pseudouridine1911/1915/1917 synthase
VTDHEPLVVEASAEGGRLDVYIRDHVEGLGRAALRRMIESGLVRVDGKRASAAQRVRAGQRIELNAPATTAAVPDAEAPLALVYEDDALVIADKPAGMPTHPLAPGERGTLASALLARFPEMAGLGYSPREPGIVHRLDTDTSGLVLAARTRAAFEALRAQLDAGTIDKRYLALCRGLPGAPAVHEAHLIAQGKRVLVQLEAPSLRAQPITTEILSAQPHGAFALLELRVCRARRHQIRAHLAVLGHPIASDALYGGPMLPGLGRHFLHASALRLSHPVTGAELYAKAELPADLQEALASAGGAT